MNRLLVVCFVVSVFASCNKDKANFEGYMKMDVDGKSVTADLESRANSAVNTDSLFIYGRWSTGN
jgi:hypothetical protein